MITVIVLVAELRRVVSSECRYELTAFFSAGGAGAGREKSLAPRDRGVGEVGIYIETRTEPPRTRGNVGKTRHDMNTRSRHTSHTCGIMHRWDWAGLGAKGKRGVAGHEYVGSCIVSSI